MGISQIPRSPILSWTGNTPIIFSSSRQFPNLWRQIWWKCLHSPTAVTIEKEVEEYLNSLHCKIEEHLLTPADYYPTKEGSYSVRLRIIESGVSIVDLSINVPNLAAAQSVCESWPYKYQNVYDKIMEELL